jgi:hypothetical protein
LVTRLLWAVAPLKTLPLWADHFPGRCSASASAYHHPESVVRRIAYNLFRHHQYLDSRHLARADEPGSAC